MNSSARAPAYDLMKLIVAILLLLLFLILLRRGNASSEIPTLTPLPPPAEAASAISAMDTATPPPEPVATTAPTLSHTATPPPPDPSPTATTASAAPTFTAQSEPTSTATPGMPPGGSLCELATSPSRLHVGMNATIMRRLNFRSSPGIQNNWLRTNGPGTIVEVVDGPVCRPYFMGVYVWWQIRLPDGTIGWSAEAPINGTYYFLKPGP